MTPGSELDTMKAVENAFLKVEDLAARNRILRWAWDKFSTDAPPSAPHKIKRKKDLKSLNRRKGQPKAKTAVSILKDLNLRPKGKKSFIEFANEKQPKGHPEQCTIAVYYLQHVINIGKITPSHIFTCYRDVKKWRLSSNLPVILRVIASRKGWIDTANIEDIKVTPHGMNLVDQDLPRKKKK